MATLSRAAGWLVISSSYQERRGTCATIAPTGGITAAMFCVWV